MLQVAFEAMIALLWLKLENIKVTMAAVLLEGLKELNESLHLHAFP